MKVGENSSKLPEVATKGSKKVSKFSFTKKAIENLIPTEKRTYYRDSQVHGLTVAVDPTGRRSFWHYRKVQGKPERTKIGLFPEVSIEGARKEAQRLNVVIGDGGNPAQERRAVREEMTLQELFNTHWLQHAKKHKRTWKDDERMFNKYLHGWRLKKLSSISRKDVNTLHTHVGSANGKYTANRVIELLCAMFNRAGSDWGYGGANPAKGIEPYPERERKRFLNPDELRALFAALEQVPAGSIRDYVLLSLFTGARQGNVVSMRWDEIDWTLSLWNIPGQKAKEDEDISVPLTPVAIDILAKRKADSLKACSMEASDASPWVFPGKGKTGHLVEPKRAWKNVLMRAGITNFRAHDLRHTIGSWQAIGGSSLLIIGKSLGHGDSKSTERYAHLSQNPVRESMTKAQNAMLTAGGAAGLLGGEK